MSRTEAKTRLAKLRAEYCRSMLAISCQPEGSGFATQEEMRKAVADLYTGSIAALEKLATK